jgi:hypothetical protein
MSSRRLSLDLQAPCINRHSQQHMNDLKSDGPTTFLKSNRGKTCRSSPWYLPMRVCKSVSGGSGIVTLEIWISEMLPSMRVLWGLEGPHLSEKMYNYVKDHKNMKYFYIHVIHFATCIWYQGTIL